MVSFKILYCGPARDFTGTNQEILTVGTNTECLLSDVVDLVKTKHPRIAEYISCCAYSIGLQYAELDSVVHENDEVAVIPPVTAG